MSTKPYTLLVVEDSDFQRSVIINLLKDDYVIIEASTASEALKIIAEQHVDAVLLDYLLPDYNGIEILPQFIKRKLPVVLMTAEGSEEIAIEAMKKGVDDYLVKRKLSREKVVQSLNEAIQKKKLVKHSIGSNTDFPKLPAYQIHKQIGRGSYATVWDAIHEFSGQRVALKIVRNNKKLDENSLQRFEREAKLMRLLKHPNIATLYDSSMNESMGYCAMEFIDGSTLQEFIKNESLLEFEVLIIFIKICHALQHAHEKGVVHRDLKPTNIMINKDAEPKIIDFGLGKFTFFDAAASIDVFQTMDGMAIGTPMYMSPEQIKGDVDVIDGRADLYALGVMLYQILLGVHPYGDNCKELRKALETAVAGTIKPPHLYIPSFDTELESIIMKSLAADRESRYQSAEEIANALQAYLDKN